MKTFINNSATALTRVLFVENNIDGTVGGSHRCLYDLVTHLDQKIFIPVIIFYQNNIYADLLRDKGIEVHVWEHEYANEIKDISSTTSIKKYLALLKAIFFRIKFLRKYSIDLVHLNNSPANGYLDWLPAAKLLTIPCITHSRADWLLPQKSISRYLIGKFDAIIAISKYIRNALIHKGIKPESIHLIYDGIDIDGFLSRVTQSPDALRKEFGIKDDTLFVAMIGHIRSWKGQDIVLDALSLLPASIRTKIHIVFVGAPNREDSNYEKKLKSSINKNNLEKLVTFTGARNDVPDIMNAADVILHASTIPEPFGLVVIEGMALGKTVIASSLGGPSEIISSNSGLLFNPDNIDELKNILEDLVQNLSQNSTKYSAAVSRAREFNITQSVNNIQKLYELIQNR